MFAIRNLSVLAYANGFTLWHYKCAPCTLDEARDHAFFAHAGDMLATGDIILMSGPAGALVRVVVPGEGGKPSVVAL